MKKSKQIIALLLAAALPLFAAGCSTEQAKALDEITEPKISAVASDSAYEKAVDESLSSYAKLSTGESITLDFGKAVTVNTVTLREKGSNCEKFTIYGETADGIRVNLFGGEIIDDYLYCSFADTEITKLIFEVQKSSKAVKLQDISVYNREKKDAKSFRVHAYYALWGDSSYFTDKVDDESTIRSFDVVTDAIIIGNIYWNEDGSLKYPAESLRAEVDALQKIIGDRDVRIWACVLNPRDEEGWCDNKASSKAIKNNLDTLTDNILKLCEEYGFDGVDFDWEYPRTPSNWSAYNKLLINIKPKLEAKGLLLSSALGPWGNLMSEEAKKTLDFVNVMSYDWAKNSRKNHAEFYTCHYFSAEYFLNHGYTKEQLVLGVPFYSVDGKSGATRVYNDLPYTEKGQDTVPLDGLNYYGNGFNTIYAKTAFTVDNDFAGMMIWNGQFDVSHDSELSLFKAMDEAIKNRSK